MPTQPFYRILTLVILITLAVSCAPQTPPALPSVKPTDAPATPPPAAPTDTVPAPTQKPPRGTKAPGGNQGQGQGQGSDASQSLVFAIPEHFLDVILGRPTDTSVTLSLLAYSDQAVTVSYGTQETTMGTESVNLTASQPSEITLQNLTPDTPHFYTINDGEKQTFHTARASGSTFTFTIQADSHLDSNTSAEVYLQTLANQRADNPDFIIDLGDTFMTDKYKPYTDAAPQYLAQRYFLAQLGKPLYLVLGNHDGEGAPRGQDGLEMSAWSANLRTKYFPNPAPDAFYSGNTTPDSNLGSLENYYAWEWGDALFIVLDPYTFTPPLRNDSSLWTNTLGETQYQWLKTTLETSPAKWKFIFIHQLISGFDKNGRGGVEVAPFYEWGGQNPDGSDGFAANRPGWDMPIHQLLLTNHVNAVFHGHDHLFVKQELDGIIYQECPQPGNSRPGNTDSAAEYGYLSGDVLGGPGHIRVMVSPNGVTVDYVRSEGGQVNYSYTIQP
jgi:predicted phosphodiesterase